VRSISVNADVQGRVEQKGYDASVIPSTDTSIAWTSGTWLNAPPEVAPDSGDLVVTAAEGSDLWRTTAYGFVHDDGHGLLRSFEPGTAVEVSFRLDDGAQFDQAGILVRADSRHWVKAGVEVVDGTPQLGAVVTHEVSDWSARPVPEWSGAVVTIRVSRAGDALTVRARRQDDAWQFVRLAPWPPELATQAGPYCCAPTRAGLRVRFTAWRTGPADLRLHE
jgi:regulation of enolase protein 1 (concanavalin A-like superfamily)